MAKRPTREQLQAAYGRSLRPIIAPGLDVLFCGINPSLYSGAVGHHFAGPSNRFWKVLHAAGFTDRILSHEEDQQLPAYGCGVTNLVNFATARADELSADDLVKGGRQLKRSLQKHRPRVLAVVGMGAYRTAFGQPRAQIGLQPEPLAATPVWVLPNPSGLNANYSLTDLASLYTEVRSFSPPSTKR